MRKEYKSVEDYLQRVLDEPVEEVGSESHQVVEYLLADNGKELKDIIFDLYQFW